MAHKKSLRIPALIIAVLLLAGALYSSKLLLGSAQHGHSAQQASGERKVLFWYAPMNPSYHSDHPGKSPMGMDLLPKYADAQPAAPAQNASTEKPSAERKVLFWYDAMNAQHHYDKPGKAPDGMDLVPQYAEDQTPQTAQAAESAPGTVEISPEKQQLIGVRTAEVKREPLVREVRTTGQITADETKIAHIHVKVNGFIDKVYVDYIGQQLQKGQPVFTLYSPDLLATEEEYLIARRGEQTMGKSQFVEVAQGCGVAAALGSRTAEAVGHQRRADQKAG